MSLIPGTPLQYAETHFKFKLPWSLLYRPWPEILVDAPFQFVPGVSQTLWIVVRDAHRFPVIIESVEIKIQNETAPKADFTTQAIQLGIEAKEQFGFYPINLEELPPGKYGIQCKVTVQNLQSGKRRNFLRWNYPFLKPTPLKIQVLKEFPPKPEGYIAGEMHCHTHYSADHVEHGASPAVLQKAAAAVGLDFVSCTDHAYDFAFLTEDYTQSAPSPMPRFEALKREVEECNICANALNATNAEIKKNSAPLMIAGEEVSVGNSKGENVHMTVLGADCFLPGLGDCGRNWLNNRPTFKIPELLKMTASHCFAAHPYQEMSGLEKFIFRRGFWHSEDLQTNSNHPIRGIQFWNGIRDEGFKLGREWWIQELGKENYLLPIGGNDAHGDLNETTAVSLPLISLKNNRHHIFGKVRTVIKLQETEDSNKKNADLTLEDVNKAFSFDNDYITDGPALWWEKIIDRGDPSVRFSARSNSETGGAFRYIKIYGRRRLPNGKLAPKEELHQASQVAARPSTDITVPFEDFAYLRTECETATSKFALTSAAVHKKNI